MKKEKKVRIIVNEQWDVIFSTSKIFGKDAYIITYTPCRDVPKIRII